MPFIYRNGEVVPARITVDISHRVHDSEGESLLLRRAGIASAMVGTRNITTDRNIDLGDGAFTVMARLVRAIWKGTVLDQMARTSRAMTY